MGLFGGKKKKSSSSGFGIVLVIGVAVFALSKNPSALHQFQAGLKKTGTSSTVMSSNGTYSCKALENLWVSQGGSSSSAFTAAEVAKAESGGIANEVSSNTNGSVDRGLWQINSAWGSLSTLDPAGNARSTIKISHNGTNWTPWVTYQRGLQNGKC